MINRADFKFFLQFLMNAKGRKIDLLSGHRKLVPLVVPIPDKMRFVIFGHVMARVKKSCLSLTN
jgi:hypothetical protein